MEKRYLLKRILEASFVCAFLLLVIQGCASFSDGSGRVNSSADAGSDTERIERFLTGDERVSVTRNSGVPTIIVSNEKGNAGDTVEVLVAFVNNPGLLASAMTLYYDDSSLKLIEIENGELFRSSLEMTCSDKLENGCNILWSGTDLSEQQSLEGIVATIRFQVSRKMKSGRTPIVLIPDIDGNLDQNLQPVFVGIENGMIEVSN